MDSKLMTLKEVADYTKLNENVVDRMAENGEIPAQKVARQWRFDRAAIDAWMASPESRRVRAAFGAGRNSGESVVNQQLPPEATGIPEPVTVSKALSAGRINMNLKASDKDGILRALVALVIDPNDRSTSETLFNALKAREDLCSTCVNEGVAIPHSRNALVGLVEQPILAYGRHRAGIDFGALDGQLVRHFFLLCAPNVRQHLQLLGRLARLINNAEFRAKLNATKQPADVIALIRAGEESIERRS
jgi:nitrogen PTS system EIIA component